MYFSSYINIDDRFFSFIYSENWDENLPPTDLVTPLSFNHSVGNLIITFLFVFNLCFILFESELLCQDNFLHNVNIHMFVRSLSIQCFENQMKSTRLHFLLSHSF